MADVLLKLRPLDPIVTEVPLVLRYDRKQGESKMRVGSTVWRSARARPPSAPRADGLAS